MRIEFAAVLRHLDQLRLVMECVQQEDASAIGQTQPWCPSPTGSAWPLLASEIRKILSPPTDAIHLPSGLNWAAVTGVV